MKFLFSTVLEYYRVVTAHVLALYKAENLWW